MGPSNMSAVTIAGRQVTISHLRPGWDLLDLLKPKVLVTEAYANVLDPDLDRALEELYKA